MNKMKTYFKEPEIPCSVCKQESAKKGWHLSNANFCSLECMINYIETVNLQLDRMEEEIKTIEKKIESQEKFIKKIEGDKLPSFKKTGGKYGRRRRKELKPT